MSALVPHSRRLVLFFGFLDTPPGGCLFQARGALVGQPPGRQTLGGFSDTRPLFPGQSGLCFSLITKLFPFYHGLTKKQI